MSKCECHGTRTPIKRSRFPYNRGTKTEHDLPIPTYICKAYAEIIPNETTCSIPDCRNVCAARIDIDFSTACYLVYKNRVVVGPYCRNSCAFEAFSQKASKKSTCSHQCSVYAWLRTAAFSENPFFISHPRTMTSAEVVKFSDLF